MLIMQSKRIKLSSSEHSKSCAMQNTSMQKTKKKLTEYRQHKLLLISFKTYLKNCKNVDPKSQNDYNLMIELINK